MAQQATQAAVIAEKNEKTISWLESGQGEPVVFLHAMAGSRTAWAPQVTGLSAQFRCVAWDMPGFGASAAPAPDLGMEHVVAMLAAFLRDALRIGSAHLVGLSVGGMILQHFAAAHPQMCRSVTILDSSPKFGFGGDMKPSDFANPILAELAAGRSVEAFSDAMVNAIVAPGCPQPIRAEAIAAMSRATRAGLELATRLIADHDALDKLPRITCPALIMAGEKDAETPPTYAAEIARRIPGAAMTVIPGAGHIANLERPEAVTRRLGFFLETGL